MKPLVVIMLYGIALMSLCSFSTAETILESDNGECLTFKEISSSIINLAWDPTCFNGSTKYEIIQIGDKNCTKSNYGCTDSECSIDTIGMNCFPIVEYIKPCQNITYSITGDLYDEPLSRETQVAPLIKSEDWKLSAIVNDENEEVVVSWGPPADTGSDDVECATNATVSATCSGYVPDYVEDGLDPPGTGTAVLSVGNCSRGDSIIVTVTYILEIPTETKESRTESFTGPSTAEPSTMIEVVTSTIETSTQGPSTAEPSTTIEVVTSTIETSTQGTGGLSAGVGLIAGSIALCYIKKILLF